MSYDKAIDDLNGFDCVFIMINMHHAYTACSITFMESFKEATLNGRLNKNKLSSLVIEFKSG